MTAKQIKRGRPLVQDRMHTEAFTLPGTLKEKLKKQAEKEGVPQSEIVRNLLKAYLK